jgi:2-methylcitrate dehydratase PrpD
MTTIESLADYVAHFTVDDLPSTILDRALLSTLDTLAAAAGGFHTTNATATRTAALALFGSGDVPVWFGADKTMVGGAMLANCAAASALDVDDGHRAAAGHPGASIVPAVLASAFNVESDGPRMLAAVALGYEIALRIAAARRPDPSSSYASGRWCGYGVAAALGWLHGLKRDELAQALAIVGPESPQSLPQGASRNMGTVKGSSPWATLTGLAAVERARVGATGPVDILDLEFAYDPARISQDLGNSWQIEATYLKPYASCRYTHPAIDAVLAIAREHNLIVGEIDDLIVEIFPEAQKIPNQRRPDTLEAAQFSIPFCVALTTLRGGDALRPLRETSLREESVLALSERVDVVFADEFAGQFPSRTPARVTIKVQGHTYAKQVEHPLGDVANPLGRADVEAKFFALANDVLSRQAVQQIIDAADDMRSGSAASLLRALADPSLANRISR